MLTSRFESFLVASGLSVMFATSAFAAEASGYISLAVSTKPAWGLGTGETQAAADQVALKECRQNQGVDCKITQRQAGGCLAVARTAHHDGIGLAPTLEKAEALAISNCGDGGKFNGCEIADRHCIK